MEFLELIDSLRSEDASTGAIYRGEGVSTRGRASSLMEASVYQRRLVEVAEFVERVMDGKTPSYHLKEALSTDDFPLLFGDVLDRILLGNYREAPNDFEQYMKVRQVRDFRTVKRFHVDGAEGTLEEVGQGAQYPESSLTEGKYEYAVRKYGRRMPFHWETMINDDLDALKDVPMRFGKAARRSEARFATELYADVNGPHASFFTGGNANILAANTELGTTINAPFSALALAAAMQQQSELLDSDNEPIIVEMFHLVVGPGLEVTARNVLNAASLELTRAGGSPNVSNSGEARLLISNWMAGRITLHVNPYLPIVASAAKQSWFMFADPGGESRCALEFGRLRGHAEPEIFIKEPNARRVGGGQVNPMDGDFDTDALDYKVRHVFGGGRQDPKMAIGSDGTGA